MIDKIAFKEHVRNSLLNKGLLVESLVNNKLDIEEFVSVYGNFYYFEALDGHEATSEQSGIFSEFSEVIKFHKLVQQEVVDRVYIGTAELESEYLKSGRISKSDAKEKLTAYWNEYHSSVYALNNK